MVVGVNNNNNNNPKYKADTAADRRSIWLGGHLYHVFKGIFTYQSAVTTRISQISLVYFNMCYIITLIHKTLMMRERETERKRSSKIQVEVCNVSIWGSLCCNLALIYRIYFLCRAG